MYHIEDSNKCPREKEAEKASGKLQEVRGPLERPPLKTAISTKAGRKEEASLGDIWGQQKCPGSRSGQCKGPEAGVGLLESGKGGAREPQRRVGYLVCPWPRTQPLTPTCCKRSCNIRWLSLHDRPGSQTGKNKQCVISMIEITLYNNIKKPRGRAVKKAPRNNEIR